MAKLVFILLGQNSYGDVKKAVQDAEYRAKVMNEYTLVG